ncbi:BQ2448_6236 [Microbotryum intermedium]|uniref:BQ2448_6236 protein n=1 Tax=Microbotryum intermedium TaxID=269621 RepID=A0A238FRS4_9BASI|nr:BQ2448_6236 [Microbotryum intermedium]
MQTGDPKSPPGAPPPPASAPPTAPIGTEKTQVTNVVGQKQTYAAATTATALASIMAAIQAIPGNRTDRWVQAIFATKDYLSTAATSLKFSALNATRNIVNPFSHALEVTLSHQSLSMAPVKDKGDLVACVRSLLSPNTPFCFDIDVPFPAGFEAFTPQIIGLQHSSNLPAGAIHHHIMVGFASAEARDAALAMPPMLTWHSAKARFAKAHHFHCNMVELRINVGVSVVPSKEEIVTTFQSVIQDLFSKGMNLCTCGINVTAICHDYEKEAAYVRCHFVGHVEKCPVVQERKQKEVEELVRERVREGAGMGAEEGQTEADEQNNNNTIIISNTNNISEAVAPGRSLGTNTLELRNHFAGLEVEDGQEDEDAGQENEDVGQEEEGEEDAGGKADDEDSGMDSEVSAGVNVIKIEDEEDVEDHRESENDGIDEDEVMKEGTGEGEEEVLMEVKEETATEVEEEVEQEMEQDRINDDAATTTTTVSRESKPQEPMLPPLSPTTLAKSLCKAEEWDRVQVEHNACTRAEEEAKVNAQLDTEEPLIQHNFAMWDKEDGELRFINICGTAAKAKKMKMKRSQMVADLSDPSDEPTNAKRVMIQAKNQVGKSGGTEGRRVTRLMLVAAAVQVGVTKVDGGKGKKMVRPQA